MAKGFPVKINNPKEVGAATASSFGDTVQSYFDSMLYNPINGGYMGKLTNAQVTTGSGYSCGIGAWGTGGRMQEITELWAYSDRKIGVSLYIGWHIANAWQPIAITFILIPGQLLRIPINYLQRGGYALSMFVNKWYDADTTDATVQLTFTGTIKTDDVITDASFNTLYVGDSISTGTGVTHTNEMYHFQFRDYLRKQGINTRNEIRSWPGSQTNQHVVLAKNNSYNLPNTKLFVVALGTNDVAQTIPIETYKDNLRAMADTWLYTGKQDSVVLFLGPPPVYGATREANSLPYRQAGLDVANEYTNNRVFAIDLTGAFNRTDANNFVNTDTAGDQIHPNASGMKGIATALATWCAGTRGQVFISKLKALN